MDGSGGAGHEGVSIKNFIVEVRLFCVAIQRMHIHLLANPIHFPMKR